ncbi:hypothetical protein TeGR_g7703 [Tetraparma gracilis]|uniref:Uncharacterized protein n=1 Tax=Tetraparma gracilis TaxID=2962635 RepID=A0ABQ6MV09_9STRA|nr:hypothetical protein TeGR_g7703 [Tetraparma gracilis]
MLWSLFAREFSQQARAIARTVSNAPNLDVGSAPSDPRRPSMRLAIEDVSKATSDTKKKEKMDALLTKMKVIYAIDVFLYLVVLATNIKAVVTNETFFGSNQNIIMRLLLFILGMGMGVTLETLALYIHYKELNGMGLTDAQKAVSERVFDDIHFDIVMMSLLANSVSYMSPNPGGTVPLECPYRYSWESQNECDVFYNDVAECEEPCSVSDFDSSFSDSLSKFGNYAGLAMDAVLCFHCLKNYRDIYPSVFGLAIMTSVMNVHGSIKLDSAEAGMLSILIMFAISLIIMCRYCYAGCNMGEACCKCGGYSFQFTCLGTGMCLVGVLPYCIAVGVAFVDAPALVTVDGGGGGMVIAALSPEWAAALGDALRVGGVVPYVEAASRGATATTAAEAVHLWRATRKGEVVVVAIDDAAEGGVPGAPQQMVVQAPPGSAAGSSLFVQGPFGPFSVVIPEGVAPGQQFIAMVPSPEGGMPGAPRQMAAPAGAVEMTAAQRIERDQRRGCRCLGQCIVFVLLGGLLVFLLIVAAVLFL